MIIRLNKMRWESRSVNLKLVTEVIKISGCGSANIHDQTVLDAKLIGLVVIKGTSMHIRRNNNSRTPPRSKKRVRGDMRLRLIKAFIISAWQT
jgi:hypothetical protein